MNPEEKNKLILEHYDIQAKHMTAMHMELGLLWNIPICCINQFCNESAMSSNMMPIAVVRQIKHRKIIPPTFEYVPCDKCMRKI